jgi:hypothetical protein
MVHSFSTNASRHRFIGSVASVEGSTGSLPWVVLCAAGRYTSPGTVMSDQGNAARRNSRSRALRFSSRCIASGLLHAQSTNPSLSTMNLSAFMSRNVDAIVDEWESFAKTLLPIAGTMSRLALRDHCRDILLAAVADMQTQETERQRASEPSSRRAMHARAQSRTRPLPSTARYGISPASTSCSWWPSFELCEPASWRCGSAGRPALRPRAWLVRARSKTSCGSTSRSIKPSRSRSTATRRP